MENTLTRDRLFKWQSNCKPAASTSNLQENPYRRIRVKRMFDMKTLLEIETHDQLWTLMKGRPGWIRQETEEGEVSYLLISSSRKCWAKASLPSHLLSASPDALQNFTDVVNKFEQDDVFAVWETFKKCPIPLKNTMLHHHGGGENSSVGTSKHLYDRKLPSESPNDMASKLYTG